MALRDLVAKSPNTEAPDRALFGDQYDLKIDRLILDLIKVCDAVDTAGVNSLGGFPLPGTAPSAGNFLTFDGTNWVYANGTSGAPTGAAGGNLAGTYPNPKVVKIQDVAISATAPTNGQVLIYDSGISAWKPFSSTTLTTNAGSLNTIPIAMPAPVEDQPLVFNGTEYVPTSLPLVSQNILPPPASSTDYIAGSAGATAFKTVGATETTLGLTVSATPVKRGDSFTSAGTVRFDSTTRPGWILIQPSNNDTANTFVWTYPLTGGSPVGVALWCANSFDDITTKTDVAAMSFVFSQSSMGGIPDIANSLAVSVTSTATPNEWTVRSAIRTAGVITSDTTTTFSSPVYPFPLLCLEKQMTTYRVWAGLDKNSLHLIGNSYLSTINPDRLSIAVFSNGRPNTVFGINQIIKTANALL